MKLTNFEALTFDCYGTLIDWETGLLEALAPLLTQLPTPLPEGRILEDFAAAEAAQEAATPSMLYSDVLAHVHRRLATSWGVEALAGQAEAFGASVPQWPAFADSPSSLSYLGQHYKLVILSNVDHASFVGSRQRLGVTFDAVYLAEDIGSYKPERRNFNYLIDHLAADFGISQDKILHTAQSLFHDHVPAGELGLARAWIDRRHDRGGCGATPPTETPPQVDFHFTSLAEMVSAHRKALGETEAEA